MAQSKIGVVLSGCGANDGSEIHEAVATLLAISRAGATAVCLAPDAPQSDTIDHLHRKPSGEARNMLIEAARVCRGAIRDIASIDPRELDAVILPGGFGAAKNLSTFAQDGASCTVRPDVEQLLVEMHHAKKPIGAICIAPALVARVFSSRGIPVEVTIGNDAEAAEQIRRMGARHSVRKTTEICVDEENRIVTTPAYMTAETIAEVFEGIEKAVGKVLRMIP
ncbi:MAG: isoprenoid biosynthesis glyoxalase ElbB [Candidatus Eisenbacteria bacterium]